MKNNWEEEIIQNIKDCGQSLIDNAENIVSEYSNHKYARGLTITCYVSERDEAPYISVDTSFYPEKLIERYMQCQ